jgi:hypothetical protein
MPVRCYGFCEKHTHHHVLRTLPAYLIPQSSMDSRNLTTIGSPFVGSSRISSALSPCHAPIAFSSVLGQSSSTSAWRSADPSLKNVTVLNAEGHGRAHDGQRPSVYLGATSTTTHRACVLCRAATCGKADAWRPGLTSSSAFQCLCGRGQEGVCNRARGPIPSYFPIGFDLDIVRVFFFQINRQNRLYHR